MKFHLNYNIEQSHEENVKSGAVVVVKDTGPSPAELKERARKKVREGEGSCRVLSAL